MRGRGERDRVEVLEDQVASLKVLARRLWDSLRVRTGGEVDALLGDLDRDWRRAVDRLWDAVETVWDRHQVAIEPCRMVLDRRCAGLPTDWPIQHEMYLGRWPDGTTRNLTRDQVLMMGGQDLDPTESGPDERVPF